MNYTINKKDESSLELDHQRYSAVDIFSTEGRIGRQRYFVYSIVLPLALFLVLASIAGFISKMSSAASVVSYAILAVSVIAVLLLMVRLTIQRCHDFNASSGLAIFALIPFANFIFALIPGNNGLNSYGETPEPAPLFIKILSFALSVLLVAVVSFVVMNFISFDLKAFLNLQ